MKSVFIPQNDANSSSAIIREWTIADKSIVSKNQIVAHVETSKAIYDVESPCDGTLIIKATLGAEVSFTTPIAIIIEPGESVDLTDETLISKSKNQKEIKATKKAQALAANYNINLELIEKNGIISEEDVLKLVGSTNKKSSEIFLNPNQMPIGVKKVLVIGAGNALAQISDILSHQHEYSIVGCVDDTEKPISKSPFGVPLLGRISEAKSLFKERVIDCAIISISSSVKARKEIFQMVSSWEIPFINAIDPSARINRFSNLGVGNVICSFVHIGTYTSIGDNNFISAHCSIDHHNIWGSNITLGPGCHFSGRVKVEDDVKFATGIFVQNGIVIGQNSTIASGAMITGSIPMDSIVKTQVGYSVIKKT